MKSIKLIMIDSCSNHNKFYNMTELGNGCFEAHYGRVGASGQRKTYPMSRWYELHDQKLRKGYQDVTDLHTTVTPVTPSGGTYKEIKNKSVRELMDSLLSFSMKNLRHNYNVSDEEVTSSMVQKAQKILTYLGLCKDTVDFNENLLDLYATIPRRMGKVEDFMCHSISEMSSILIREQDVLDVMAAKVNYNSRISAPSSDKTICQELGITVTPATKLEKEQILKHLGSESRGLFKRAWRVKNRETEKNFKSFMVDNGYGEEDIHYLYHGSRNQNWLGIVSEGLSLNPNAPITGKMFGYGLYFAPRAKKSIGYTSLTGSYWANGSDSTAYLAVYKVAYNNPLDVYSHKSEYCSYRGLKGSKDALFAHKGQMLHNDELIIYNEDQCTLQYLIELQN